MSLSMQTPILTTEQCKHSAQTASRIMLQLDCGIADWNFEVLRPRLYLSVHAL